jgi:hypothetical protein
VIIRARFVAGFGQLERRSEVFGEHGRYEVWVGDETQAIMARVLETPDLLEALRLARGWMDSIDLQEAASAQQGGNEGGEHPAQQAGSDQVDARGGDAERGQAE